MGPDLCNQAQDTLGLGFPEFSWPPSLPLSLCICIYLSPAVLSLHLSKSTWPSRPTSGLQEAFHHHLSEHRPSKPSAGRVLSGGLGWPPLIAPAKREARGQAPAAHLLAGQCKLRETEQGLRSGDRSSPGRRRPPQGCLQVSQPQRAGFERWGRCH